jgi:hypothetical protein
MTTGYDVRGSSGRPAPPMSLSRAQRAAMFQRWLSAEATAPAGLSSAAAPAAAAGLGTATAAASVEAGGTSEEDFDLEEREQELAGGEEHVEEQEQVCRRTACSWPAPAVRSLVR